MKAHVPWIVDALPRCHLDINIWELKISDALSTNQQLVTLSHNYVSCEWEWKKDGEDICAIAIQM